MKQKILLTYLESGFGHITSMESIYDALNARYSDKYDIVKCNLLREDGNKNLLRLEKFLIAQVENTNKIPLFGKFIFWFIGLLGNHHIMRFFHRQMVPKSFYAGLDALKRRQPDVIVTNHYFTNLLAVEYKRRIAPDVVIINYNPDNTMHAFWDRRDGIFVVNNKYALEKALKYKFKESNLRLVTPCVRKAIAENVLTRAELRQKHDLPQDKFTVVVADGGYMYGRGPKFARALIKKGLPITLCIIAGKNKKRYDEFKAIADGRSRLKVADGMTLKVYEFMTDAYELYGAADLFLTKGGPNAVLDSVYMRTPVMIDYCPHLIEEMTAKFFVKMHGCGECAFTKRKALKRITALSKDPAKLDEYRDNIEKLIAEGNGADLIADIIDEEYTRAHADNKIADDDGGNGGDGSAGLSGENSVDKGDRDDGDNVAAYANIVIDGGSDGEREKADDGVARVV